MSVRRVRRGDPAKGTVREVWMIDVDLQLPSGERRRVRKVSPVQTRRAAEAFERELRSRLLAGTYNQKEVPTFKTFASEFLENYAEPQNKRSEVAGKKASLKNHVLPALGHLRLHEVSCRHLERFKASKLKTLAPATVNKMLRLISKMLNVALDWGLIESVPKIRCVRIPKQPFDFLDFQEAERLVKATDTEWRPMVTLALNTGLRLGELIGLQWVDVDIERCQLQVLRSSWQGHIDSPKSGKDRMVPLNAKAVEALQQQHHRRGIWVFCRLNGNMLKQHHCKPPLQRACKQAMLRSVQWHVLRHTFASHLVMRGVPLKAVQELLGHASMDMTLRYAHLTPQSRRSAVDALVVPASRHYSGTSVVNAGTPVVASEK